jgi:Bacterial extracellular solute-binding protein
MKFPLHSFPLRATDRSPPIRHEPIPISPAFPSRPQLIRLRPESLFPVFRRFPRGPKRKRHREFLGYRHQPWQVIIDDFQKTYPNIKIKWTKYSTDEIKQALRVASAAGKLPDAWFNWAAVSLRRMRRVDTPSSLRPS